MKSLNLANDISKDQWIARIDHDDIWEPKKLEIQLSFTKLNKSQVQI
jgi:hypothetical protein